MIRWMRGRLRFRQVDTVGLQYIISAADLKKGDRLLYRYDNESEWETLKCFEHWSEDDGMTEPLWYFTDGSYMYDRNIESYCLRIA